MANIIEIKDINDKELDIYARYSEAQLKHIFEPDTGIFIAESPKVVERALDSGCKPISLLMEKAHISTQGKDIISRCGDIKVFTADFDVLTKLTGFKLTRGMLSAMYRPQEVNLVDICKSAKRIAVLENVVNPTNVGAIFRSAAALNMECVLLTKGCADPLYRRAIRVSMGTVFQVPWAYIGNNQEEWNEKGIDILHNLGFKTAAMALKEDTVNIDDINLNSEEKLAIILGTEGEGLSDNTIEKSDYTVKIPMSNGVDSLNVAAASAVAFWQLGRQ